MPELDPELNKEVGNVFQELKALIDLPDEAIDTSDIPETTNWDDAVIGKFHVGELIFLDKTGDTRMQWKAKDPTEVEAARKEFDKYMAKGYAAYKVSKSGDEKELIHAFDPKAERLLLRPPMVGG
jgi:hypothetical protein